MKFRPKLHLDKRDRKHMIADTFAFLLALVPVILMYPDEMEQLLQYFGVVPPLATIITAVGIVALRRVLSLPVSENDTPDTPTI